MILSELLKNLDSLSLLQEKLGTLAQLKLGKMIDILKQHTYSYGRGAKAVTKVSDQSNKFDRQSARIDNTSEIVDIGVIKNGLVDIRKAYKKYPSAQAFALYADGKAIAFVLADDYALGGSSRDCIISYDLSSLQAEIDKQHEEKKAAMTQDWQKRHADENKTRTTSRKEVKKSYNNKIEKFEGELYPTSQVKSFLENLQSLAGDKKITAKLVLKQTEGDKKRRERYLNPKDLIAGLEDIQTRLKKFKNAKNPSVESIHEFLKLADSNIKQVKFAGQTYSTESKNPYSAAISPVSLLKGTAFEIKYDCIDPGSYNNVTVSYRYDPKTMMIIPYKAAWLGVDENGKRSDQHAILHKDSYFEKEHGLKAEDKNEIIKKILTFVKDGKYYHAEKLLDDAKKAGHDWPELKTIEKSIKAEQEKSKD